MPIYWKPKYATRSQRHRAWVKQQAQREQALRREPRASLFARFRGWLSRNS
jgi:hypothetical protein